MPTYDTSLPTEFCWTKFGAEAGESPTAIRGRKEKERTRNGGLFYWGIGNSIIPSLRLLLARVRAPEVLFTPMLSRPAIADSSPERVVAWRRGVGLDGEPHDLGASVVTSRAPLESSPRRHFALVCYSAEPLDAGPSSLSFSGSAVVNLASGSSVGASQVTSVVRQASARDRRGSEYTVAFCARLVAPYFLTLLEADEVRASPRVVTSPRESVLLGA